MPRFYRDFSHFFLKATAILKIFYGPSDMEHGEYTKYE